MHRVELKENFLRYLLNSHRNVPNAPCGVERTVYLLFPNTITTVPNAPCGVESYMQNAYMSESSVVPNAPCGVESWRY